MKRRCNVAAMPVVVCSPSGGAEREDELCVEEHLFLYVDGAFLGRVVHTPGHDEDLAFGLALAEGVIKQASDVAGIAVTLQSRNVRRIDLTLAPACAARLRRQDAPRPWREIAMPSPSPQQPAWRIAPHTLSQCMQQMEARQTIFPRTGGAHCASLFTPKGELLALVEDIGRHNALDKAIGACLRTGTLPQAGIGVMSSRLSWELVRKANAAGLPLLAGISAATSLAVATAEACCITLVGRVRRGAMTVYCHKERLAFPSLASQSGRVHPLPGAC